MALRIKDGKVVSVAPPTRLTQKQLDKMENTPRDEKLIKQATLRKYNVVSR
ncbi:MAG: hypothetical protein JXQ76_08430 [Campylobacterales bacterium]|nr:hypothetical protein [Campylobacterales bacterium]